MGCWHGWHGCAPYGGPWYHVPYGRGWYEPPEWDPEVDWPPGRQARRGRPADPGAAMADLEARLAELSDEVRRIGDELAAIRGADSAGETGRSSP